MSTDNLPLHLDYSYKTMSGAVLDNAEKDPDFTALSFNGKPENRTGKRGNMLSKNNWFSMCKRL